MVHSERPQLRSPEHSTYLCRLNKLFENERAIDCNGRRLKAHKSVLAERILDDKPDIVNNVNTTVLRSLIEHMYFNQAATAKEDFRSLIEAAKFEVEGLCEMDALSSDENIVSSSDISYADDLNNFIMIDENTSSTNDFSFSPADDILNDKTDDRGSFVVTPPTTESAQILLSLANTCSHKSFFSNDEELTDDNLSDQSSLEYEIVDSQSPETNGFNESILKSYLTKDVIKSADDLVDESKVDKFTSTDDHECPFLVAAPKSSSCTSAETVDEDSRSNTNTATYPDPSTAHLGDVIANHVRTCPELESDPGAVIIFRPDARGDLRKYVISTQDIERLRTMNAIRRGGASSPPVVPPQRELVAGAYVTKVLESPRVALTSLPVREAGIVRTRKNSYRFNDNLSLNGENMFDELDQHMGMDEDTPKEMMLDHNYYANMNDELVRGILQDRPVARTEPYVNGNANKPDTSELFADRLGVLNNTISDELTNHTPPVFAVPRKRELPSASPHRPSKKKARLASTLPFRAVKTLNGFARLKNEHTNGNYTNGNHTNGNYTNGNHTNANYTNGNHTNGNYMISNHTNANYTNSNHTNVNHTIGNHTNGLEGVDTIS